MAHKCKEKVIKDLLKANDDIKSVRLLVFGEETSGQPIEIGIEKKKRDGTVIVKYEKSFTTHTYCPFCGMQY